MISIELNHISKHQVGNRRKVVTIIRVHANRTVWLIPVLSVQMGSAVQDRSASKREKRIYAVTCLAGLKLRE